MSAMPKISLVTCSYQQARYLDATIRSVLDQRYERLEYLVIDGGSTDGSREIIERHAPRLHAWVSEPDSGQTHALIKGFGRATGDVMGWLCSDDLLLPGALMAVGRFFRDNPDVDAVYGDALWIDAEGGYIRPKNEPGFNRFIFQFAYDYIPQPSMFWRRWLYERVGGLNQEFNVAMDADLWERFSRYGRIAHVPLYLSCMRHYPEQKVNALRPQGDREGARIRARHPWARFPLLQPGLRALGRVGRVLHKASVGGYHRRVPVELIAALERYRIQPEPERLMADSSSDDGTMAGAVHRQTDTP